MSDNTKDDSTQMDLSSASLSTDMSMLDELFPSLGNGESSTNHFTNQLAFLLNTLGSSDDEGSEGTNLLSPLQLSPPRLNEIHALATANLISQTQEAIMQEYNITDLDFEKTISTETVKNGAFMCNEPFQDGRQVSDPGNSGDINTLENNILNSCFQDTSLSHNNNEVSYLERLSSCLDNKCCEEHTQAVHCQKNPESLVGANDISKDTVEQNSCLTSGKLETSDTAQYVPFTNVKENITSPNNQRKFEASFTDTANNVLLQTFSVSSSSLSPSKIKKELETSALQNSNLDNRCGNIVTKFHQFSNINNHDKTEPDGNLLEHSNVQTVNILECDTLSQEKTYNNEFLNYVLPPKKRHSDWNGMAFSEIKTQCENAEKASIDVKLENELKDNCTRPMTVLKPVEDKDKVSDKGIVFVCAICLKQFSCMDDLEQHSTDHQKYICPYPGCVRTFTYRSHLRYHKKTHKGEKHHQCSECGKVFAQAQHLDVHTMAHSQTKPFICGECNKSFTTLGSLKNHMRIHSGERPYVCDIKGCTKGFAELSSLKKHKITHTGEKSYRCDICGKCFTQAGSRSHHMKKHGEKIC